MKTLKRTWADISLDNLEYNYRSIRAHLPSGTRFLGVMKADAYGHGAVPVSRALADLGAEYLAVSNLEEAVQIRRGEVRLPILILGYTPPEYAANMIFLDITQEVHSLPYAQELNEALAGTNYILNVHLKLDTGMTRIGFFAYDNDRTLDELKQLRLEGTDEQLPTFDEVLALFEHETPLIIELKTARGNHMALAKAVCERLDSYQGEFCIESFDPFALIDVKKLRPEICRGQLSMNFEKDKAGLPWYKRFIAGNLLLNFLTVPDFIAYKFEDRSSYCLRSCVRVWGAQEVDWTIRTKEDLLACEAAGGIPIFERFDPEA